MPLFRVFHHNVSADRSAACSERAFAEWPLHYSRVATVEASALGEVFQLTNHIDSDWTKNPEVQLLFADPARLRSTSVGDVIIDDQEFVYGVAGIGFTPLGTLQRCRTCDLPVYDWKVGTGSTPLGLWCRACIRQSLRQIGWAI